MDLSAPCSVHRCRGRRDRRGFTSRPARAVEAAGLFTIMRVSVNNPLEDALVGASLQRRAGTFRVSKGGGALETVFSTEALEDFGRAAGPGRYHVDEFFPEPVAGHTSRRWGAVLKFPDGRRVVLEPDPWEE
jgi:hypothetical protein